MKKILGGQKIKIKLKNSNKYNFIFSNTIIDKPEHKQRLSVLLKLLSSQNTFMMIDEKLDNKGVAMDNGNQEQNTNLNTNNPQIQEANNNIGVPMQQSVPQPTIATQPLLPVQPQSSTNTNQPIETFQANANKKRETMCEIGFWISIFGLLISYFSFSYAVLLFLLSFSFALGGLKTKKRGKAITTIILTSISLLLIIIAVIVIGME